MGGSAFIGITVERMPNAIYVKCRNNATRRLETVFKYVVCPRKAPDKTDHGDLDIIVAELVSGEFSLDKIARKLDAKFIRRGDEDHFDYFGVELALLLSDDSQGSQGSQSSQNSQNPHGYQTPRSSRSSQGPEPAKGPEPSKNPKPSKGPQAPKSRQPSKGPRSSRDTKHIVQLDLHNLPTKADLDWYAWRQDFGDIPMILNYMARPAGLLINDKGLWLCLEEYSTYKKEDGKVPLSMDPVEVMDFLGLDGRRHAEGFGSNYEVFEWIANSSMLDPRHFNRKSSKYAALIHAVHCLSRTPILRPLSLLFKCLTQGSLLLPQHFTEEPSTYAKMVKECRRLDWAPMFKQFFLEWMPKHRSTLALRPAVPDRDAIRERAVAYFGVSEKVQKKVDAHNARVRYLKMRNLVDDYIPLAYSLDMRTIARNAFKRWIELGPDGAPVVVDRYQPLDEQMTWLHDCRLSLEEFAMWIKRVGRETIATEKEHSDRRRFKAIAAQNPGRFAELRSDGDSGTAQVAGTNGQDE